MTVWRVFLVIGIFIAATIGWMILGVSIVQRTKHADDILTGEVAELWGSEHVQKAPSFIYYSYEKEKRVNEETGKEFYVDVKKTHFYDPERSTISVDFSLDYRRKGLIWFSTYKVIFNGKYVFKNYGDKPLHGFCEFQFPASGAIYDNFKIVIDGDEFDTQGKMGTFISIPVYLESQKEKEMIITYNSQGLNSWKYLFGEGVNSVKNFLLTSKTNFDNPDFPSGTISPSEKEKIPQGWKFIWNYKDLVTGYNIGIEMPKKMNPGPLASRISFFAPIPLLFFFTTLLIFGGVQKRNLHPMHFFLLGASIFSFHLLYAYLVDHIDIHVTFWISACVSLLLAVPYMKKVVDTKFAILVVGLSELIFLILFSYAFFWPGWTGLIITIGSILTLAILMFSTAKVKWGEVFK
ncbi:inner membrane CreD family protein [candidate division WOR-3 bacterium]|nr:inner membrane CreD family protein [candidate division WOR-3 bacterium]